MRDQNYGAKAFLKERLMKMKWRAEGSCMDAASPRDVAAIGCADAVKGGRAASEHRASDVSEPVTS